jgi:hypothetical protein
MVLVVMKDGSECVDGGELHVTWGRWCRCHGGVDCVQRMDDFVFRGHVWAREFVVSKSDGIADDDRSRCFG